MSPRSQNRPAPLTVRRLRARPLAVLAALLGPLLGGALAGCRAGGGPDLGEPSAPLRLPRPTQEGPIEHRLDEDAERRNKDARRAWMAAMHRAAPDVDWRAVERENGRREQWRRGLLARAAEAGESTGALPALAGLGGWEEIGSRNQAGRTHCATIGPDGPAGRRLYVGSALGGVWRGALDGTGWVPLGDNLYGGAHELLVVPGERSGDPDVVLVATDGGAVNVTRDDGGTWEPAAGLEALTSVRGVGVLDDAARTLVVFGNHGTTFGERVGLFASTDRGRTFQARWTSNANGRGAIWVPRAGPGAAGTIWMTHQGRLRASTDGGFTFPVVSTIDAASERSRICGSEAGAPTLYVALRLSGTWRLFRSDDAGGSFAQVNTLSDFWESMAASVHSPDVVVVGGVEARRSTDGGVTLSKINNWYDYYSDPVNRLHADLPGIYCWPDPDFPLLGERWYFCTDGGAFESLDQGASVVNRSLSGLGIGQYYSTLSSATDPDLVLAGSQDQGYQRGLRQASTEPGPSTDFAQLISGDYGHLTSADGTHQLVYSTYPGFVLVQEGETSPTLLSPFVDFPPGSDHAWLPPVVADPLDPESFFFLGDRLWRYTRTSGPYWSHAQHSAHDFGAGAAAWLSALGFAPSDLQRAYAVTNDGSLWRSSDRGVTWAPAISTAPGSHYFYGSAIAVSPTDADTAVVGGSGYSTPGVVRTTDGGLTWQADTFGLPSTLVYDLCWAGDGSGDVYAATEAGPYRRDAATGAWENLQALGAPITLYWSVESVAGGERIRFGTYGRGVWDWRPLPGAATWSAYGTGLGGANVLDLDSATPPRVGTTVALAVAGASGASTGLVVSAPDPARLAMWGGTVLVDGFHGVARMRIDASGSGVRELDIPADGTLVGTTICFQALVWDPAQPQGVALSNGLAGTIGP